MSREARTETPTTDEGRAQEWVRTIWNDPRDEHAKVLRLIAQVRAEERAQIAAHLREWADDAERIPGPPQYEDALRDAAEDIERGDHLQATQPQPPWTCPQCGWSP